jgi:peroxiredoxin
MATDSTPTALGTAAPDFELPTADGSGRVSLADFADAPALLVAFLSNHCPYVLHVESALGEFAEEYSEKGLAVVGICSNDVENYPEDAPEEMVGQIARAGFTFPYLHDETQEVAKAFGAACTPDFFLYDGARRLAYRGQFDDTRPHSAATPTGETMRAAADAVLRGEAVPEPHLPSVGCGIKWKPGNEPPAQTML